MIILVGLFSVPATAFIFLQNKKIQTHLAQEIARQVSENLNADFNVESVNMILFNRVVLKNVLFRDQYLDTLLYSPQLIVTLRKFSKPGKQIELSKIRLNQSTIRLSVDTTRTANLKFIIESLKNQRKDTTKVKWKFSARKIEIENSRFLFENHFKERSVDYGINFSDAVLNDLDVKISKLTVDNNTVNFNIDKLTFQEKSGFILNDLSAIASLSKHFMHIENVQAESPYSKISAEFLDFRFNSFKDFRDKDFGQKVNLDFIFNPSEWSLTDLAYYAPKLYGLNEEFILQGKLQGKISSLKGKDIQINYKNHTSFSGNFDFVGLPNLQETFIYFDIKNLTTDVSNLEHFEIPGGQNEPVDVSESLVRLGHITYQGKFAGFFNDFVTYGRFETELGKVYSDISIRPDSTEHINFNGKLRTEGFNLGKLLNLENRIGRISMNGNVDGSSSPGGVIKGDLDGTISSLQLNGYNYRNIYLSGELSNNMFDGSFTIKDPNLQMDFFGKVDFSDTIPVFDFTADVETANLYPLNISKDIPDYTLSCFLNANFTGGNIDEFEGEIRLVNSLFQKADKQIQIYDFTLVTQHRSDTNRLQLSSDLIDAEIIGKYEFNNLWTATNFIFKHHFPALRKKDNLSFDINQAKYNNFWFKYDFKNIFPITSFFIPEIEIAQNSTLSGHFNPADYEFEMTGFFPYFKYKENLCKDLHIRSVSNDSLITFTTNSENIQLGDNLNFKNLNLDLDAARDSIFYTIYWDNEGQIRYSGKFSGLADFSKEKGRKNPVISLLSDSTGLIINDSLWIFSRSAITFDSSSIQFDHLNIFRNNQHLSINGKISENPEDRLFLTFRNLDLSNFNPATQGIGLKLDGILEGRAYLSNLYNQPMFISDLMIDELAINQEPLGETKILAEWIDSDKKIHLTVSSMRGNLKTASIEGDYIPETKMIDFVAELDKLRLNILDPYLTGRISDIKGIASGQVTMTGFIDRPALNGVLKLNKTSFLVDYLQTEYSLSNDVNINNNKISFNHFEIYDQQGNQAILNGTIDSKYLRDFRFNLNLTTENFYFLNTREMHNDKYYGTAIGTGVINLTGPSDNLNLSISARAVQNTRLFIPMNKGKKIAENNFITFINVDEDVMVQDVENEYTVDLTALNMNFELEMTPDAEVQIIFDEKVGDIMKGYGSGNIRLEIKKNEKLQMFGEYIFSRGEYLFTLKNIINKKLKVEQGGTITWNGNPAEAILNIRAVYPTNASPYILVADAPDYLKKRMPVDCHLVMTGNLMNPNIDFEIVMPTAEEETKNFVRNAINTEEELTKQFLSLLVINNFSSTQTGYGANGSGGTTGVGMAGVTTSEMLSSQLSNWLSQISNDFDIGVNYRPGDEISSDQVEVALSTQILDDRVTIRTNVDVTGNSTTNPSQATNTSSIAGDFDVDVKLTDDGKLRVKAYNRSNDDLLYKTAPYTQGVGFVYREDFDHFGEVTQRYIKAISSPEKKKKKKKSNSQGSSPDH